MPIGSAIASATNIAAESDLERGAGGVEETDQLVAAERAVGAEDEQRRLRVRRLDQLSEVVHEDGFRHRDVCPRPGRPQVGVGRVRERVDTVVPDQPRHDRSAERAPRAGPRSRKTSATSDQRSRRRRAHVDRHGPLGRASPPAAREELIRFWSLSSGSSQVARATSCYAVSLAPDVGARRSSARPRAIM